MRPSLSVLALAATLGAACENTPSEAYVAADRARNGIINACRTINSAAPYPNNGPTAQFRIQGDPDCVQRIAKEFKPSSEGCTILVSPPNSDMPTAVGKDVTAVTLDCRKSERARQTYSE